MFQEWGFLLGEIWVLILLAALLGLLAGWLIWGGRKTEVNVDTSEADRLRADLDACRKKHAAKDARIKELEGENANASAKIAAAAAAAAAVPAAAAVAAPAAEPAGDPEGIDYDGDGVIEGKDEGVKPATLTAARGGKADDLKRVKGIGPKMEKLCNKLGFYHFDQLASWTPDEVAWVDANLEGFKGRVSRDEWVSQAKLLATGAETEFSKRVDKGGMY